MAPLLLLHGGLALGLVVDVRRPAVPGDVRRLDRERGLGLGREQMRLRPLLIGHGLGDARAVAARRDAAPQQAEPCGAAAMRAHAAALAEGLGRCAIAPISRGRVLASITGLDRLGTRVEVRVEVPPRRLAHSRGGRVVGHALRPLVVARVGQPCGVGGGVALRLRRAAARDVGRCAALETRGGGVEQLDARRLRVLRAGKVSIVGADLARAQIHCAAFFFFIAEGDDGEAWVVAVDG
mmetsp:Transcript_29993/g.71273  ORF Transcript_29993/g.71273 Transcript_29993/m.71273 type:complete len:238 (+) Transcript_29993:335-1048(+)